MGLKKPKENIKNNAVKKAYERNKIALINANRVNDAELQIDKIHADGFKDKNNGFIIFAVKDGKWQQWSFKRDEFDNKFLMNLISLETDTYITINSFKTPKRLLTNIFSINAVWSDIDYYKKRKYKELSYEEMLDVLQKDKLIQKIQPSFYMSSGKGIYAFWLLDKAHGNCVPIWNKIMETIHDKLKKYGADPNALDAARVLRLAGSNHTGTNKKAKVIKDIFQKEDFKRYTISELSEALLPKLQYTREEFEKIKLEKYKSKKKKEEFKLIRNFNIHTLNYARMKDLQKLVELRQGECEGLREFIIFLYRYWGNCYHKDKDIALQESFELNDLFKKPLPDFEVTEATKRAEVAADIWQEKLEEYWALEDKPAVRIHFAKTGAYVYSNKTLIKKLSITQEEMRDLETIFNTKEKNRRNKDYRAEWMRASRLNENGLKAREQAKLDKLYAIIELKEKGFKTKEIAVKLECSERLIQMYNKEIKEKNITKPKAKSQEIKPILLEKVTDTELELIG